MSADAALIAQQFEWQRRYPQGLVRMSHGEGDSGSILHVPPCRICLTALIQLMQSYAWWRRPVDAGLKSGVLFNDKKEVLRAQRVCLITCLLFVTGAYIDISAHTTSAHVSLSPSVHSHRQAADSYFHPPETFFFPLSKLLNTTLSPPSHRNIGLSPVCMVS